MTGQLMNATQAAKYVGVCRRSFYTLIGEGRIRAVQVGASKKYRKSDLDKFVAALKPAR